MRDEIGALNFASQYQQTPATPDGGLFKRKWLRLVEQVPAADGGGDYFVSIDNAWSTSNTADYSAISVVYAKNSKFYVLKAEHGYETLKTKALYYIERLRANHRPVTFVIEAAGSGISLLKPA